MYRNVLIPVDGSDGSQKAVDHGLDLAEMFDAAAHFVFVVDEGIYDHYALMDDVDNAEASLERYGEQVLAEARAMAKGTGLNVFEHVVRGVPHEAIVECANDVDANLIVMGTERQSDDRRRLLGSVTERVVRTSGRPVQVVKAE